jgi:Arc/MetJ family transcription regulator
MDDDTPFFWQRALAYFHGRRRRPFLSAGWRHEADELLTQAMAAAGLTTKKATVEEALRRLAQDHQRRNALADITRLGWEGDLSAMREERRTGPRP